MLTGTIIAEDERATEIAREALRAAGCREITVVDHNDVDGVLTGARTRADIVVVTATNIRLLTRLVALGVPVVAVCRHEYIDAAFLTGATECVASPPHVRELESRIRHALRTRAQQQLQRGREREMADMIKRLEGTRVELEQQLCVDPLTGVATRRHALERLDAECRRATRDNTMLGVVMCDLDWFHAYNEQYGHVGGDRCLRRVAEAMSGCLRRPSDFLGRYGGEEFVAVLPNTDVAGTRYVVESMRAAVQALGVPHAASPCARVVTVTAGFTSGQITAELTPEDVIHAADAALMRAKVRGRNQICGSEEPELDTEAPSIGRATTSRSPLPFGIAVSLAR